MVSDDDGDNSDNKKKYESSKFDEPPKKRFNYLSFFFSNHNKRQNIQIDDNTTISSSLSIISQNINIILNLVKDNKKANEMKEIWNQLDGKLKSTFHLDK